jgi:hypothetical protein
MRPRVRRCRARTIPPGLRAWLALLAEFREILRPPSPTSKPAPPPRPPEAA